MVVSQGRLRDESCMGIARHSLGFLFYPEGLVGTKEEAPDTEKLVDQNKPMVRQIRSSIRSPSA